MINSANRILAVTLALSIAHTFLFGQDPHTDREYASQIVQEELAAFNAEWENSSSSRDMTVTFHLRDDSEAGKAIRISSKESGRSPQLLLLEPLMNLSPMKDVQANSYLPGITINNHWLDIKTETNGDTRTSFLQFDVSGLDGNVTKATLRLFAETYNYNNGAPVPVSAYTVADDSWSEFTLKWSNKPDSGELLATTEVTTLGQWYEFDVTVLVAAEAGADGIASLQLIDDSVADNVVRFSSNMSEENQPYLLIETDAEAAEPIVLDASNDAFLRDGEHADTVYNTDSILVDGNANEGSWHQGILQFNVTDVEQLERAILRLHVEESDGSVPLTIWSSMDSGNWDEATVTWNMSPSPGVPLATETVSENGQWYQFEISDISQIVYQDPDYALYGIEYVASLLDLDYPGLESLKAAVEDADWSAAEDALLDYFDNRDYSVFPNARSDATEASDAIIHYFPGHANSSPSFMGADIDWLGTALRPDGSVETDNEWYFFFHRLYWWRSLAWAYNTSQNEAFFEEWRYELIKYSHDLFPLEDQIWTVRRGMETAYRCDMLATALPYFLQSPNFDSRLLHFALSSFHQQAEHIRTVYAGSGNHLVHELKQVFRNSIYFPEFKKAQEWFNESMELGPTRIFVDIYPDGMNKEQIFHYQSGVYMESFTSFYVLLQEFGYLDFLPEGYQEQLVKMADVYLHSVFPDFKVNQFGDSWQKKEGNYYNGSYAFKNHVTRFAPNYPWLEFMTSNGNSGTPPRQLNIAYPISGFYFFRSDWDRNAVYMPIKNTEGKAWHTQIDNGTFDLYAYGRHLMTDSGAYIYNSDNPEDQQLREYFRSTKMHQTITLDYESIRMEPSFTFWQDSEKLAALIFENDSYTQLKHQRCVLFIDNSYFLIYDRAIGDASGEVRAHFSLAPTDWIMNAADFSAETQYSGGANLLIKGFELDEDLAMTMQEEDGWISYQLGSKEERPAWSYKINKDSSDDEVSFLTALLPYPGESESPGIVNASVEDAGSLLTFTLTIDDVTYTAELDLANNSSTLFTDRGDFSEEYSAVLEGAITRGDEWMLLDWFGWLSGINNSIFYSYELNEWVYLIPSDTYREEFWMWMYGSSKWVWIVNKDYFPWVFSFTDWDWIKLYE